MKKKIKKIIKIILIPIIILIFGNIAVYLYCLITPKMEINKSQSYYLYDNKNELVFQTNDDWIPLDKINKNLIKVRKSQRRGYGFSYLECFFFVA